LIDLFNGYRQSRMIVCCDVYKINYLDCDTIQMWDRCLETKIQEHRSDINKNNGCLSVISNHIQKNHEFD